MISDIVKLFIAGKQLKQAKKLAKTQRPTRETPEALQRFVDMTRFESSVAGLPGQSRMENKIAESGANATNAVLRSQQSPAAMLAGISAVNKNQNDAYADLTMQGAQYRDAKQGDYYNALGALANDELQQWQWNQQDPYLNNMAAASALKNAGLSNLVTGIGGIEQGAVDIATLVAGAKGNKSAAPGAAAAPAPGYNPNAGGFGGLQPMQQGFGGVGGSTGYTAPQYTTPDDWTLYGDHMRRIYPTTSEETLKALMPKFKQQFNSAYYGGM